MANFIGLVYATLKNEGVDTSKLSTDEAIKKYNELQEKSGGKAGEKEGTPAENRKMNNKKERESTEEDTLTEEDYKKHLQKQMQNRIAVKQAEELIVNSDIDFSDIIGESDYDYTRIFFDGKPEEEYEKTKELLNQKKYKYNEKTNKRGAKFLEIKGEKIVDDDKSNLNKQIKNEFKQDIEEFLRDEDIKTTTSGWDKEFLVIKTTDNNKAFNKIRRNYLYNDTFEKNGNIYIKIEQDDQNKGTSAEQKRMKQPKSEYIDHDVFDKAEKYYTSVEGRDERSIQAFRDVKEKINEMANAGSSYNDIDTELTNDFSTLEYKTNKLMDKKDKTEQEKAEIISNRRKLEGMSFAISQLYKVWKK